MVQGAWCIFNRIPSQEGISVVEPCVVSREP